MEKLEWEEQEVVEFFEFMKLKVERFPGKDSQRKRRTPDFIVTNENGFLFYCEQKTMEFENLMSGMSPKTAQDKLKNSMQRASGQFESVNPSRLVPNVLCWRSKNPQVNYTHLENLLEAKIDAFGSVVNLESFHRRARPFFSIIDLHIFMPPWGRPDMIYTPKDDFFLQRLTRIFSEELLNSWGEQNMSPEKDARAVLEKKYG